MNRLMTSKKKALHKNYYEFCLKIDYTKYIYVVYLIDTPIIDILMNIKYS